MNTYYVSLTRDLIGCYLRFEAESERAVRRYLEHEYLDKKTGVWKLPWCAVYTSVSPQRIGNLNPTIVITPDCGQLFEVDYE